MKRSLTACVRGFAAVLLLGGVMWLMPGCVTHAEVGYGYDYDYYPDWDVYYYPSERIYYWHDGGHWRTGRRLPSHYDLHAAHHEPFHGHTRRPWTERGR